jgi:hypothetical protein
MHPDTVGFVVVNAPDAEIKCVCLDCGKDLVAVRPDGWEPVIGSENERRDLACDVCGAVVNENPGE